MILESRILGVWCCVRHKDYRGAVLEAVNLGGDTDTTGAVAGAIPHA